MNAQDILDKSFAVVRDLDTFVLTGNWTRTWQMPGDARPNQPTSRAFQLSFRKPNEMVLAFHDDDVKFRFVGSSIFVKGPNDERARFVSGDYLSPYVAVYQTSNIPDELFTFIRFCLAPKEKSLWYVKRNSFRLVQVKEQANKLFIEGDLGSAGIVRLTVSSISYFIHSIEVTTRPNNTEMAKDLYKTFMKAVDICHTITSFGQAEEADKPVKPGADTDKPPSLHVETELSFDRVALNPKLSEAEFAI